MGWIAVIPMHKLLASWNATEAALMLGGGFAYTLGAAVFALKSPDPWPGRFGHHEIFHLAVLLGVALRSVAISGMLTDIYPARFWLTVFCV